MIFEEALKAMRVGKKVKRPCMLQKLAITETEERKQHIFIYHKCYGFFIPYKADSDDILAEDWEVVDD